MEIKDKILRQDMEEIAGDGNLTDNLRNSTVFVTGATGLLGSQVVLALACMNRMQNSNIQIVAMARNEEKVKKVFGDLADERDLTVYYGDINSPIDYPGNVDYIIHALKGTEYILEFKKKKKISSMVYLSSLEVYGAPEGEKQRIGEKDYGYLDPMSIRSSYSEGKRMAECMCAAYAGEYDVPVKVARLSQTFGAGVEYQDSRVFAEFARCAVEKKDIILHTKGRTIRSYCYTKDAIRAILYILSKGQKGEAYNVTNMDTAVSIREMAELVCSLYPENGIQVKVEIPEDAASFGYNPEMVIRLDSSKLQELGWKPTVGLKEMFERMIKSGFSSCETEG